VSGPAAGLAVIVFQLVKDRGIEMLGPILVLAGLLQVIAGSLSLGRWFRAMSPAVVYGMLAGIGVLLASGQFYVMLDEKPHHGIENLFSIPESLFALRTGEHVPAAIVGFLTMAVLILWTKFRPASLGLVPGALIAVMTGTAVAWFFNLQVLHVDVPRNLLDAFRWPTADSFLKLRQSQLVISAVAMAFVASAETLLSAAAVDRLHNGQRTDFNRELRAQGLGNMLCGFLGAIPMTGVIVRSSANVQAGAKTRRSAILHGVWLLAFVVAFPQVLRLVPTASLGAILVYTGFKLIDWQSVKELLKYGRIPVAIYTLTVVGIVAADLLTGVIIGLLASLMKLIYKISQIKLNFQLDDPNHAAHLDLEGAATFLNIPEISAILEQVPPDTALHIHTAQLMYIDHSCLDLFSNWEQQRASTGNTLVVEWDHLMARFKRQGLPASDLKPYMR
jgi:MFS superfamily sulfate permease-like transporter